MFDHVIRELQGLQGSVQIPVDFEIDDRGYLDRQCPSAECGDHFKILYEDWATIVSDDVVYCPRCRHEEVATEWNTPEQHEHIRRAALNYTRRRIGDALQRGARRVNSRQNRSNFISMRMSYRPGPVFALLPPSAAEVMTQEFQCGDCGCRYTSIGTAFFCPACGRTSILESFANAMETVTNTMATLPTVQRTIEPDLGQDAATDIGCHIRENALVKVVSSFQKYAEECFAQLDNAGNFPERRNLFQNIRRSDATWRAATGIGYADMLTDDEYRRLIIYFEQRHVLEHQDGIVDQEYIGRANDSRFAAGQRLVVTEGYVLDLVSIIEKLAQEIAPPTKL